MNVVEKDGLTEAVRKRAREAGADLVGFADLGGVDEFPCAVVIAMRHSPELLADPENMPNADYHAEYLALNARLDAAAAGVVELRRGAGYGARANPATGAGRLVPPMVR